MQNIKNVTFEFDELAKIIECTKERVFKKINEETIIMYFRIGGFISKEMQGKSNSDLFIERIADFFKVEYPTLKDFDRSNLYKMKILVLALFYVQGKTMR